MLNWSFVGYKMTLGIGTLGLCAMSAEMWRDEVDVIPMLAAIVAPLLMFLVAPLFAVLFGNAEKETLVGRLVQGLASAWYLAFASVVVGAYCTQKVVPPTWLVYSLLAAWGAIPCVAALCLIGSATIRDAVGPSRHDPLRETADSIAEPIDFDSDYC